MNQAFLILAVTLLLGGCGRTLPVIAEIPDFSLVNQSGREIRKRDLEGRVWIANFIYSGCGDVCPLLIQKMKGLGHQMQSVNNSGEFRLVSFTVDPENDTPQRLGDYAKAIQADPEKWFFLTGSVGAIQKTVEEGFKLSMGKRDNTPIFHSEKFVLVDRHSRIRGYYDTDRQGLQQLVRGIHRLSDERDQ